MLKRFDRYAVEVHASVEHGLAAQILCYRSDGFVGRIDFHTNEALPVSYLWHPTGITDPDRIYLILAMQIDRFAAIEGILRTERPFALELWPVGEMFGASTDGYGGVLRSVDEETVGGEERRSFRMPRSRATEWHSPKT